MPADPPDGRDEMQRRQDGGNAVQASDGSICSLQASVKPVHSDCRNRGKARRYKGLRPLAGR